MIFLSAGLSITSQVPFRVRAEISEAMALFQWSESGPIVACLKNLGSEVSADSAFAMVISDRASASEASVIDWSSLLSVDRERLTSHQLLGGCIVRPKRDVCLIGRGASVLSDPELETMDEGSR